MTVGKTVSLWVGAIVTDRGAAIVNGRRCEDVRECVADDGTIHRVIARVIRELPEVTRRASF